MEEIFYPSADKVTTIHACVWKPAGTIKGAVQIIHGMSEYAARYSPFAERLAAEGYLVCAEDHLGHGKSVTSPDNLGWFNREHDYNTVLCDIRRLFEEARPLAGDVPWFVLGHSMGSFFCRLYIARYGSDFSGAVVMGSGFKGKLTLNTALCAVRLNALFCGWKHRSNLIKNLAFGSYNKKFKDEKDGKSWLSVDKGNRERYAADELCGFDFTNNGYYVLFSAIKAACSKKVISAVPKDLPVYFVAGENDPVGDYSKGVKKAYAKFKKAGVKQADITIYKGARHEILNDECSLEVCSDILAFFDKNL